MDYGLFKNINKYDNMDGYYKEIYGGQAPDLLIKDVPSSVTYDQLEQFLITNGFVAKLTWDYYGKMLLARPDWPYREPIFTRTTTFKDMILKATGVEVEFVEEWKRGQTALLEGRDTGEMG